MEQNVAQSAAQPRFQTLLLSSFAAIALLLAAIGLYAVLSYMVVQRTHEIGLRMALGAQRGKVLQLVLNRGISLAIVGLALGIAVAALLTRFLASLLYGLKPSDPATLIAAAILLIATALAAGWLPAWRASRVQPMEALRHE